MLWYAIASNVLEKRTIEFDSRHQDTSPLQQQDTFRWITRRLMFRKTNHDLVTCGLPKSARIIETRRTSTISRLFGTLLIKQIPRKIATLTISCLPVKFSLGQTHPNNRCVISETAQHEKILKCPINNIRSAVMFGFVRIAKSTSPVTIHIECSGFQLT